MSHAYVEINAGDARNALRAVQNKTMGKGRRLRGVTVTMSSQSELMRSVSLLFVMSCLHLHSLTTFKAIPQLAWQFRKLKTYIGWTRSYWCRSCFGERPS